MYRNMLVPGAGSLRLYTDLYDKSKNCLIEAKADATRNDIRMAIGQLCDYSRFVNPSHRAVLFDDQPTPEMTKLLKSQRIYAVWREGGGFRDNAAGRFT